MSTPSRAELVRLLPAFSAGSDDAAAWTMGPEVFGEVEADCLLMSVALAAWLRDRGYDAEVTELAVSSDLDGLVGPLHVVVECCGLWIDWTAKQFHNADGVDVVVDDIGCPLVWEAGAPYPLPTISAVRV